MFLGGRFALCMQIEGLDGFTNIQQPGGFQLGLVCYLNIYILYDQT